MEVVNVVHRGIIDGRYHIDTRIRLFGRIHIFTNSIDPIGIKMKTWDLDCLTKQWSIDNIKTYINDIYNDKYFMYVYNYEQWEKQLNENTL